MNMNNKDKKNFEVNTDTSNFANKGQGFKNEVRDVADKAKQAAFGSKNKPQAEERNLNTNEKNNESRTNY